MCHTRIFAPWQLVIISRTKLLIIFSRREKPFGVYKVNTTVSFINDLAY